MASKCRQIATSKSCPLSWTTLFNRAKRRVRVAPIYLPNVRLWDLLRTSFSPFSNPKPQFSSLPSLAYSDTSLTSCKLRPTSSQYLPSLISYLSTPTLYFPTSRSTSFQVVVVVRLVQIECFVTRLQAGDSSLIFSLSVRPFNSFAWHGE